MAVKHISAIQGRQIAFSSHEVRVCTPCAFRLTSTGIAFGAPPTML